MFSNLPEEDAEIIVREYCGAISRKFKLREFSVKEHDDDDADENDVLKNDGN